MFPWLFYPEVQLVLFSCLGALVTYAALIVVCSLAFHRPIGDFTTKVFGMLLLLSMVFHWLHLMQAHFYEVSLHFDKRWYCRLPGSSWISSAVLDRSLTNCSIPNKVCPSTGVPPSFVPWHLHPISVLGSLLVAFIRESSLIAGGSIGTFWKGTISPFPWYLRLPVLLLQSGLVVLFLVAYFGFSVSAFFGAVRVQLGGISAHAPFAAAGGIVPLESSDSHATLESPDSHATLESPDSHVTLESTDSHATLESPDSHATLESPDSHVGIPRVPSAQTLRTLRRRLIDQMSKNLY